MSAIVQFSHVTKRYGSQVALDNVSLEIAPGTVFALLGENGAGKSTAIRLLLGLAEPDSGRTEVLGLESVVHSQEIRRRVGYVSERPTLYGWMTVDEIGWFCAGFYADGYLTRYRQMAEQFKLPPGKKLKTLSKGMHAKVSLALAMGHDPDLLILDEPTSGLDALVRREFLDSMVSRAADGKTVLLSSHQIQEVERVADMVAIIREGKLLVVERLEKLKAEIQELTVTLTQSGDVPPILSGELLRQRRRSRQWQLLVRGTDERAMAALSSDPAVEAIDRRTPSLEEIFVAYMKPDGRQAETSPVDQLVEESQP